MADDVGAGAGAVTAGGVTIPERGAAAYIAEFFGTFTLVFFITMVVSLFVSPPIPQGVGLAPQQPFIDFAVIGLVHVFVLFMLIQTLALISGAHFNPAVTVGLWAIRQIRTIDAGIYVILQLLGGVAGGALTKAIVTDTGRGIHYGAPAVSQTILQGHTFSGMAVEAIGTFFLVWAIVGVAVNPRGLKDWAGLVIGGTLGLLVMSFGPLSGGSFNPARAFGPALVATHFDGGARFALVWLVAPVIGGVAGAVAYRYMFILPGKKGPIGMEPVG